MSASLIVALSRLFGKQERSDCTLVFYYQSIPSGEGISEARALEQQHGQNHKPQTDAEQSAANKKDCAEAPPGKCVDLPLESEMAKRRKTVETQTGFQSEPLPADSLPIGDPLPAHTLILAGGSERFRAQLDRWTVEQGYAVKPMLRVPLNSPDEQPHALTAIRFMYTGKLDVSDAASLLRVRIQAAYLQVEGCAEACDAALLALVSAASPTASLAGVAQLYGCRDWFSKAEMGPTTVQNLLNACRQRLVANTKSSVGGPQQGAAAAVGPSASTAGSGLPSLGELLSWAFGDAPSLLSDPAIRKQMEALPVAALEALLGCDNFATDSEETVLLVLMHWLQANAATAADVRQRLLKLIRLCQLSTTYLLRVLPLLTCFGIEPQELRFLQDYTFAADSKRVRMKQSTGHDFKSARYSTTRRQPPRRGPGDRSYEWSVDWSQLKAKLSTQGAAFITLDGTFSNGIPRVVSNGLEWYPSVQYNKGDDVAQVFLMCSLPPSLGLNFGGETGTLAQPGRCRMMVYGWGGGQRKEAYTLKCGVDTFVEIGRGWGSLRALPLGALPAALTPGQNSGVHATSSALADPVLFPFAQYIKAGKLWGCLEWKATE